MGILAHERNLPAMGLAALVMMLLGHPVQLAAQPARLTPEATSLPLVMPDQWDPKQAEITIRERAAKIVDAYSESDGVFSHDGRHVVFSSNRDGLDSLYVADLQDSGHKQPPRKLVDWPGRMSAPLLTWDDQSVIFASDEGGNEQTHFYRVPLAGGQVENLTPAALRRDSPLVPELDSNHLFYSGRALDQAQTNIYKTNHLVPASEHVVYRDQGTGFLSDVSRDGRHALFIRYNTHQDQQLLTVDLNSGVARLLYPKTAQASIQNATFAPDGRRVYLQTDAGTESALVLSLAASDGVELARYVEKKPATASGTGLAVDRHGINIAVAFQAGNRSEIRLLDAKTLALRSNVRLPLGDGGVNGFSDNGKHLIAHWSTPDHPTSLYSIASSTGKSETLLASSQLANELPAITTSNHFISSFDGMPIPVNVYRPKRAGRVPVIVHLHGGPAGNSSANWSAQARFFLSEGYAWVEPNIRGSSGFGRSFEAADNGAKRFDSFRDIDAVRHWLSDQGWADSNKLIVLGESFGGFLVLHEVTVNPTAWRAGVDQYGISDFLSFMDSTTGLVRQNYLHELGDPNADRELLVRLSPLAAVNRIASPLLVYAGENDPRVPRAQSDAIVDALRKRGVPVQYMLGKEEGHGVRNRDNRIQLLLRTAKFLEQAISGADIVDSEALNTPSPLK
ncbi:MAG: S9 family peptidase [Arenimonas sp.]